MPLKLLERTDRQTELGQVWRERTKTTVQHVNIAKSFITQSLQNYDVNNFGKRGREQHPTCLFNITSVLIVDFRNQLLFVFIPLEPKLNYVYLIPVLS